MCRNFVLHIFFLNFFLHIKGFDHQHQNSHAGCDCALSGHDDSVKVVVTTGFLFALDLLEAVLISDIEVFSGRYL